MYEFWCSITVCWVLYLLKLCECPKCWNVLILQFLYSQIITFTIVGFFFHYPTHLILTVAEPGSIYLLLRNTFYRFIRTYLSLLILLSSKLSLVKLLLFNSTPWLLLRCCLLYYMKNDNIDGLETTTIAIFLSIL